LVWNVETTGPQVKPDCGRMGRVAAKRGDWSGLGRSLMPVKPRFFAKYLQFSPCAGKVMRLNTAKSNDLKMH
jgi:hypothetical protein